MTSHHFSKAMVVLSTLTLSLSCGEGDNVPLYVDPTLHTSGFVTVEKGVYLHYLDFGGTGETVVLLAGAGNSAHVFDEFAPRLTDNFRVYAFTRRGFGESSQPSSGYDTKTLTTDLLAMFNELGISRAHLVGHSFAGTEMTHFAGDYPQRILRIVYLDAAYDLADQKNANMSDNPPSAPTVQDRDLASAAAFSAYVAQSQGVALPEPEIHAIYHFSPNGRFFRAVTHPAIFQAIADGKSDLDFTSLKAPALAIYTVPDVVTDLFPWLTPSSPDWALANTSLLNAQSYLATQRQKFTDTAPADTSSLLEMHGVPHYLFLAKPAEVASAVRTFLLTP